MLLLWSRQVRQRSETVAARVPSVLYCLCPSVRHSGGVPGRPSGRPSTSTPSACCSGPWPGQRAACACCAARARTRSRTTSRARWRSKWRRRSWARDRGVGAREDRGIAHRVDEAPSPGLAPDARGARPPERVADDADGFYTVLRRSTVDHKARQRSEERRAHAAMPQFTVRHASEVATSRARARHWPGARPCWRENARLNANSDS